MKINLAHLRHQGIDFAVFDADATTHFESDRRQLLLDLTLRARAAGLKVDKAALAYRAGAGLQFFGTPDLVKFLGGVGVPRWTHSIDV